jgi:hypothetical protein
MRITVCVLQPTQSAGNPNEHFMATVLLIQVWDFCRKTKMAYPGWNRQLAGTRAKGFRAEERTVIPPS